MVEGCSRRWVLWERRRWFASKMRSSSSVEPGWIRGCTCRAPGVGFESDQCVSRSWVGAEGSSVRPPTHRATDAARQPCWRARSSAAPSFQVRTLLAQTNVPPTQLSESVSLSAATSRTCQEVEHSSSRMLVVLRYHLPTMPVDETEAASFWALRRGVTRVSLVDRGKVGSRQAARQHSPATDPPR